jgi:hypothetical protein
MKYEPEKIPSVHCFLDIVNKFLEEVPIQDKQWRIFREDALWAMKIAKTILIPVGQGVPCKGRPIQIIVEPRVVEKK